MKDIFPGYYLPTEDQFKALWKDSLIVLDTNVLLELYRLPRQAREELLKVLKTLQPRLWIPYQVAMEFQRNRITVISAERNKIDDVVQAAEKHFLSLRTAIGDLKLDRRGLPIDVTAMAASLEQAAATVTAALRQAQANQPDISISDEIRDQLDQLFLGRVGEGPPSDKDLLELCADAESRFQKRIPPGYMDAEKAKSGEDGKFSHQGIVYERRFGDLILWRQIIRHVKHHKVARVMLVTGDQKDDWWWREKGRTFGPKQDLVHEMRSAANIETFWMYTPEQFLKNAQTYTKAHVSQSSLDQLKEIREDFSFEALLASKPGKSIESPRFIDEGLVYAVTQWIFESFGLAARPRVGGPTLVGRLADENIGYQVVDTRNTSGIPSRAGILSGALRVAGAKRSGFLREAHLLVCGDGPIPVIDETVSRMIEKRELNSFTWGELIDSTFIDTARILAD